MSEILKAASDERALRYLVEEVGRELVREITIDGLSYVTRSSGVQAVLPPKEAVPEPLVVSTLSSFVDYLSADIDHIDLSAALVHVTDPLGVQLVSPLAGRHRQRETLIVAQGGAPKFPFAQFLDVENFIIGLQSCFVEDEARNGLLRVTKLVKSGSELQQADNGLTQRVTVDRGVSLKSEESLPNPVTLAPYRTFPGLRQPSSPFLLRAQESPRGVTLALFEADGGAWRGAAVEIVGNELIGLLAAASLEVEVIW